MRKLILKMSISADGFVGGPNGEIDWLLRTLDDSAITWLLDTLWQAGVHIMGSRTFYDMAAYWPNSSEPLAAPMNEIPKIVFSGNGLLEPASAEHTTQALKDSIQIKLEKGINHSNVISPGAASWLKVPVASGDLATEISKLKQQEGKSILAHGGASFAQNLARLGLVDEYWLLVHPVVLGKGLPLFSALRNQLNLVLESSTVLKTGVIANIYKPAVN